MQTEWKIIKLDVMKLYCPLFNRISEEHFNLIKAARTKKAYAANQQIFKAGDKTEGVVIVIKGVVKEIYSNQEVYHGIGSILSFANLLSEKNLISLTTESFAEVFFIPSGAIFEVVGADPQFEEIFYKLSCYQLFRQSPILSKRISEESMPGVIEGSKFLRMSKPDMIQENKYGGYLFSGTLDRLNSQGVTDIENIRAGAYLEKGFDYVNRDEVRMLLFDEHAPKRFEEENKTVKSMRMSFSSDSFSVYAKQNSHDVGKLFNLIVKKIDDLN